VWIVVALLRDGSVGVVGHRFVVLGLAIRALIGRYRTLSFSGGLGAVTDASMFRGKGDVRCRE
jgi:hypothetical protein